MLMAIVGAGGARSAGEAVRGGADLVQVRAKELGARDLATLVRDVIAEVGKANRVVVNSRADIAEITGALGVHLPESGLDPREVRRAFPGLAVGVSRHDRSGLEKAAEQGADYAILGPVFATPGKEGGTLGLAGFRDIVMKARLPVIAVGGVGPESSSLVWRAGAAGVAALRPFTEPLRARSAAESFRAALKDDVA